MPSDRRVIAFRPDEAEEAILQALVKKTGLPMARILAIALREKAEHDGVVIAPTTAAGARS
jgi:hypothetical protein